MFKYDDKYIAKLISDIYAGKVTVDNLPESLYHAIADYLKKGLYKGFGSTLTTAPEKDLELLTELRDNIYMFSAAKTYQQVREMTDAIADSDGTVRSFSDFKKDASQIFGTYNKDYLKTEYDAAIGQAQNAVKWVRIEDEKDVLPFLAYSTIGDACGICAPLDGFTAAVDDPAWNTIMPMNHFNCRCIVEQLDEQQGKQQKTVGREDVNKAIGNMDDTFKMNPGKDGYVFSPDHPYFTVSKADKGLAKENFKLPIPDKDE